MTVTVYVEGDGNVRATKKRCRQGFRALLPPRPDVENVSKRDLERGLRRATRPSSKGEYHKGRHSFEILAELDPGRMIAASPHAKRLVDTLLDKSS